MMTEGLLSHDTVLVTEFGLYLSGFFLILIPYCHLVDNCGKGNLFDRRNTYSIKSMFLLTEKEEKKEIAATLEGKYCTFHFNTLIYYNAANLA